MSVFAQSNDDIVFDQSSSLLTIESAEPANSITINDSFEEAAKKNNIPYRTFDNLKDVEEGYYIITGVFSKGKNLKKVIKRLKKKGFDANSIHNTDNNLNYVYIEKYPFGLEAVDACVNDF